MVINTDSIVANSVHGQLAASEAEPRGGEVKNSSAGTKLSEQVTTAP